MCFVFITAITIYRANAQIKIANEMGEKAASELYKKIFNDKRYSCLGEKRLTVLLITHKGDNIERNFEFETILSKEVTRVLNGKNFFSNVTYVDYGKSENASIIERESNKYRSAPESAKEYAKNYTDLVNYLRPDYFLVGEVFETDNNKGFEFRFQFKLNAFDEAAMKRNLNCKETIDIDKILSEKTDLNERVLPFEPFFGISFNVPIGQFASSGVTNGIADLSSGYNAKSTIYGLNVGTNWYYQSLSNKLHKGFQPAIKANFSFNSFKSKNDNNQLSRINNFSLFLGPSFGWVNKSNSSLIEFYMQGAPSVIAYKGAYSYSSDSKNNSYNEQRIKKSTDGVDFSYRFGINGRIADIFNLGFFYQNSVFATEYSVNSGSLNPKTKNVTLSNVNFPTSFIGINLNLTLWNAQNY